MKPYSLLALCALVATPLSAEETRQLDAHEHGVGQLDIAIEEGQIAMELHAPGADIVGFEYEAKSAEDIAAVESALEVLARPLQLFEIAGAAGCTVSQASAELESEDDHDDHADEHDDDHAEHKDEHDHDDHGEEHADDDRDDHDDDAAEAGHTEFHAEYLLTCADTTAATQITFAYFDAFPNALEVEVQVISDKGATAFEVERAAPALDLSSIF